MTIMKADAVSPHFVLTPQTTTRCLAYIHYYTPKLSLKGQFLCARDLRGLAGWIGEPAPAVRRLRDHVLLAGHLVLLQAADFLQSVGGSLQLSQPVSSWLCLSRPDQIESLIAITSAEERWQKTVNDLELQDTLDFAFSTFLTQTLARQLDSKPEEYHPAVWMSEQADEEDQGWYLHLPSSLPSRLLFDLLQLGTLEPDHNLLHLSPLSIASFPACAYGRDHIRWLLESATQCPLPREKQIQLQRWLKRADAYQVNGPLLSTANPGQMRAVLENRRLKGHVFQQIGPRQALVDRAVLPHLRRWLAKRGYPLNQPSAHAERGEEVGEEADLASHWLGLRLQIGLQKMLPLPYPAPTGQLFALSKRMPAAAVEELELLAQKLLSDLEQTIQGRDAFFPARQCPTSDLIKRLETAISREQTISISYQALGRPEPQIHQVEPLRLQRRNQLLYLYAYSYRAEAYLTFRLDRVQQIET